jgi:hypothetical protein
MNHQPAGLYRPRLALLLWPELPLPPAGALPAEGEELADGE